MEIIGSLTSVFVRFNFTEKFRLRTEMKISGKLLWGWGWGWGTRPNKEGGPNPAFWQVGGVCSTRREKKKTFLSGNMGNKVRKWRLIETRERKRFCGEGETDGEGAIIFVLIGQRCLEHSCSLVMGKIWTLFLLLLRKKAENVANF